MTVRLDSRPRVGRIIVPFMVDETPPVDFKTVHLPHVIECAERGLCGICGGKIRRGPIAFIGPDDGRDCYADPWMHPECADYAMANCPFVAGKRGWRNEAEPEVAERVSMYAHNMVKRLAYNWRAHLDPMGQWHFEAVA